METVALLSCFSVAKIRRQGPGLSTRYVHVTESFLPLHLTNITSSSELLMKADSCIDHMI